MKKLDVINIKRVLAREDMKKIVAGSGTDNCRTNFNCSPHPCEEKQPGGGYLCSDCCAG